MAGDWIKVEKATTRKPEVLRIAEILKVHPDFAFALCVRFWMWCDDHLTSGHVKGVTVFTLETVFGHSGFVDALLEVGWLQAREGALVVPNFERHLSESAKARALSGERKRKQRVPKMSRSHRDKSGTREEKRREEVSPIGDTGIPVELNGEGFAEAWGEFLAYRKESKKPLAQQSIEQQLRRMALWAKKFGLPAVIDSIRESIAQGWRGVFEPKGNYGTAQQASKYPGSPRANQGAQSPARVPNPEGKNLRYPPASPNPAGGSAGHPA